MALGKALGQVLRLPWQRMQVGLTLSNISWEYQCCQLNAMQACLLLARGRRHQLNHKVHSCGRSHGKRHTVLGSLWGVERSWLLAKQREHCPILPAGQLSTKCVSCWLRAAVMSSSTPSGPVDGVGGVAALSLAACGVTAVRNSSTMLLFSASCQPDVSPAGWREVSRVQSQCRALWTG